MALVFFGLGVVGLFMGVVGFASDAIPALNEAAAAGFVVAAAIFLLGGALLARLGSIEHMMIHAARDREAVAHLLSESTAHLRELVKGGEAS